MPTKMEKQNNNKQTRLVVKLAKEVLLIASREKFFLKILLLLM